MHIGIVGLEASDFPGEEKGDGGGAAPEANGAPRGGGVPGHLSLRPLIAFNELAGLAHEEATRFRQGGPVASALEQRGSKFAFQLLEPTRQGWLGEPEAPGRFRDGAGFGDGDEAAQISQIMHEKNLYEA